MAKPTVALCTIVRDERPYLLEWIAYHQLLGVDRFLVFDNDSVDGAAQLLAELARPGVVTVAPAPGRNPGLQVAAFLAGARHLAGKCDFAAFIDVDEFLVVDDGLDVPAVLADVPADVAAVALCQIVFGSNGRATYEPGLVTSRFLRRGVEDRGEHRWIKTVARPEAVADMSSSHSVVLAHGRYAMSDGGPFVAGAFAGEADRLCHARLTLFHYMLKSREEYGWKQRRGGFTDTAERRRFDEAYFHLRDLECNAVTDMRAANRAAAVRARALALAEGLAAPVRAQALADLGA